MSKKVTSITRKLQSGGTGCEADLELLSELHAGSAAVGYGNLRGEWQETVTELPNALR